MKSFKLHTLYLVLVCLLPFGGIGFCHAAADQPQEAWVDAKLPVGAFAKDRTPPAWVKPVSIPTTTRSVPLVTLLADTQVHVGATTSTTYVNRATLSNDTTTLAQIGQFQLPFAPSYQKLRLHQLQILRAGETLDKLDTVQIRFLQREAGLEQGLYGGIVTASLLLTDVRVGDTVAIAYSIEGTNPVLGPEYIDQFSWDTLSPTERRSLIVSYPSTRNIAWKYIGDFRNEHPEPKLSTAKGMTTLTWDQGPIESIEPEENIPDNFFPARFIQFSEYGSWQAVAKWANTLFPPVPQLPAELTELVSRLKNLPNDEDKVRSALAWVQNDIRYFSVALGESSHRPYPPAEVVARRFGDCKDKSYLLITLLRELGVDAKPVFVSVRSPRSLGKFLPTPDAFDHAVVQVKVNGTKYLIDGTRLGQSGHLATLGTLQAGTQGLVADPSTKALETVVPAQPSERDLVEVSEEVTLGALGDSGKLTAKIIWHGGSAEALRLFTKSITPDQQKKMALTDYDKMYPGIELDGLPSFSDDTENNTFSMSARFNVPAMTKDFGDAWSMRFFPSNLRGVLKPPTRATRNFPVLGLLHPYVARYELTVNWPGQVAMTLDPFNQSVHNDYFEFDTTRSFRGSRFNIKASFKSKNDVVPPGDISKLLEDGKKLETQLRGFVPVEKSALKNNGLFGLGRTTLQETMRKRINTSIDRLSRTISDGRVSGEDMTDVLCNRAEAYADADQTEKGIKDAQEAVKLTPQYHRAWACRASLNFYAGDFAKSIADWNKALSLGAEAANVMYRRGQARYYLNKYQEAADDFQKAVDLSNDDEERIYAALWLSWTLKQAGRPLPEKIKNWAAENPKGAWPRPAFAMLASLLTPDDVMAEVQKKTGDERELNSAEAHFYIGQYYKNQGSMTAAEESFRATRKVGITMYIEHVAAGFELKGKMK
ncbi:MAG: DUF3857 domain-containing protein [Rhodocyclaceae bacterium]|nr:MAG: DUF3857 domain-containing protein [Rhodocyclaceae bacterium]